MRRLILGCFAAVLLAMAWSIPADGLQPPPGPGPGRAPAPAGGPPLYNPWAAPVQQPSAKMQANAQATTPAPQSTVPIFNPAYPNAPQVGWPGYGGYPGYGGGYGGYLNGAANMTVANAQYQLTTQQARVVREQANQDSLKTQRSINDEMRYEKDDWMKRHDPNTVRQENQEWELRRAVNDPPKAEIWSGQALNAILQDINKCRMAGLQAPPVPLDPFMLPLINLTDGTTRDGAGMLSNMTRFNWPMALREPAYQEARQQVEQLTRQAVSQAQTSAGVDVGVLDQLNQAMASMQGQLDNAAPDMTPDAYIGAARYLKDLKGSLKSLQDPNAANYFNGKWRAQGSTVDQLAQYMISQGLTFAPASPNGETAYTALHQAMVDYDYRLHQQGSPR